MTITNMNISPLDAHNQNIFFPIKWVFVPMSAFCFTIDYFFMYGQMKKILYHKTKIIPCNYPGKVTITKLLLCVYYVQDVDFGGVPSCPQEDLLE